MNNEPTDEKRRLLNEVFRGDAFDGQLKQRALTEFRRARFIRRAISISSAAAIVAMLVTGTLLFRASERTKTRRLATKPVQTETTPTVAIRPGASLTDEQLLAFFPPDSSFLAEVEGRKILVFRSPELREKYFH